MNHRRTASRCRRRCSTAARAPVGDRNCAAAAPSRADTVRAAHRRNATRRRAVSKAAIAAARCDAATATARQCRKWTDATNWCRRAKAMPMEAARRRSARQAVSTLAVRRWTTARAAVSRRLRRRVQAAHLRMVRRWAAYAARPGPSTRTAKSAVGSCAASLELSPAKLSSLSASWGDGGSSGGGAVAAALGSWRRESASIAAAAAGLTRNAISLPAV